MLSVTTDYATGTGCPEPYLRRIAEAGFSHVHWCHQWNTDFLYSRWEIDAIETWLRDFGLHLLDLHASHGDEKGWFSSRDYERLSGVELVKNRIEMTARLSGEVVILHAKAPKEEERVDTFWTQIHKSLDDLQPCAREQNVRIALETLNDNTPDIRRLFSEYGPEFLGLCYDSGHGNIIGRKALDDLAGMKDRLISLHLHDNDSTEDQHKLLFSGTVDWPRLAGIIATSAYDKCVSMEVSMKNMGMEDERVFLKKTYETGARFAEMVAGHGKSRFSNTSTVSI